MGEGEGPRLSKAHGSDGFDDGAGEEGSVSEMGELSAVLLSRGINLGSSFEKMGVQWRDLTRRARIPLR